MSRLLVTANSPGEMAGWVRPILAGWRERGLGPVDILLLPCTFATGQEERVARGLEGVDRVYRPSEYLRLLLSEGRDYRDGILLHLGGDLMYSALLSWRWRITSWSYLWARPWWDSAFRGYFTKDPRGVVWLKKRRVAEEKIHLTGDLVLDAVRQHVACPEPSDRPPQISYLPGSRAREVAALTPFFLALHQRLQQVYPDLQGVLHASPFLPPEELTALLESPPDPAVGGVRGVLENGALRAGETALTVATGDHYDHLARARLALSIPGTKTAEAGYLRTPVLTLLPLNRPEHLPSIGLTGLLDLLPGGRHLKGRLLLRLRDRIGLLAHPNILAGRPLLPELVEPLQLDTLSDRVVQIWQDEKKLREVSELLAELYSWEPRPADRLVDRIASHGAP